MGQALRVTSRNARFQQWEALLANRAKRQRSGEFIVQGVRPITLAVARGWQLHALLFNADVVLSRWAVQTRDAVDAAAGARAAGARAASARAADARAATVSVAVSAGLMHELGGKADAAPELLAVAALPADDLRRIPAGPGMLTVVFDRPASPGNIGTLIRSADAFGASGVIVTGHAADVYDPKSVRASTGSLFSLPVVRTPSHRPVLDWVRAVRAAGTGVAIVGAEEQGDVDVGGIDFTRPTLLLIGNETTGLSAGWRDACDHLAGVPMLGTASSLNAATAASVMLYESARQRIAARRA